jgi:mono/diheme cytochrome c family protein
MRSQGSRFGLIGALLVWAGWIAFSGTSTADMEIQKQAKAAGAEVKNCQTCHTATLPKKDSHDLNDAGKWLVAEKEKKGAAKVDGAWLKDYQKK